MFRGNPAGTIPEGGTEPAVQLASGSPDYYNGYFPGMQIGNINGYTYDGPKLSFSNKPYKAKQYNLSEYVYVIKSPTSGSNNGGSNGNNGGTNGNNGGSNGGILSDLSNLSTTDYILIIGAIVIII